MSDLAEAGRFTNRVEAELARLYLGSHDIEAVLFDTETNGFYGFFAAPFMPIRLMVFDEDLAVARELLAANSTP